LEVITPRNEEEHGCQVSLLMQKEGRVVFTALQDQGIVVDWREPNVIRVAPVPLYNRFKDVWDFIQVLKARLQ
jgi:kynureninase